MLPVQSPYFVAGTEGRPVLIPSGPAERFQLTAAQVEAHLTPVTRGVLLVSPSNPTGTSIEPDELAKIVDVVRARRSYNRR